MALRGGQGRAGVTPGRTLTLLHHPDVHAALEPAGLAVPPVVLGDLAAAVEGTGERGFFLHAPPAEKRKKKNLPGVASQILVTAPSVGL